MRRFFARAVALLMLSAAAVASVQAQPVEGRDYAALSTPQPVAAGPQVEVIEFFYYGCPICYEAQPHIARWLLRSGPDVILRRVPAVTSEGWEPFARTFYTLDAMQQLARLHWPVYDNHHFDGKQLNEEDHVVQWVASNGLDGDRFRTIWHSPEIKAKVDAAQKMLDTYGVRGVPTFIVGGRYVTSARMAGGVREMMDVVDFLVRRVRAEPATR